MTRFHCDRCDAQLTNPESFRLAGRAWPTGASQYQIHTDETFPGRHWHVMVELCDVCTRAFEAFMNATTVPLGIGEWKIAYGRGVVQGRQEVTPYDWAWMDKRRFRSE